MFSRTTFLLMLLMAIAWAQITAQRKPIGNDDILRMHNAKFDEETIIKAIAANDAAFDTSPEALVTLKDAGVTDRVLAAMLDAHSKRSGAASGSSQVGSRPGSDGNEPKLKSNPRNQPTGPIPAIYIAESADFSDDTKMEAIKTLQRKGMRIVTVREKADYILEMVRQVGKKSWRKDTKVVLSSREGEVVYTNSTRSIGGAMGDIADFIRKHHEF